VISAKATIIPPAQPKKRKLNGDSNTKNKKQKVGPTKSRKSIFERLQTNTTTTPTPKPFPKKPTKQKTTTRPKKPVLKAKLARQPTRSSSNKPKRRVDVSQLRVQINRTNKTKDVVKQERTIVGSTARAPPKSLVQKKKQRATVHPKVTKTQQRPSKPKRRLKVDTVLKTIPRPAWAKPKINLSRERRLQKVQALRQTESIKIEVKKEPIETRPVQVENPTLKTPKEEPKTEEAVQTPTDIHKPTTSVGEYTDILDLGEDNLDGDDDDFDFGE